VKHNLNYEQNTKHQLVTQCLTTSANTSKFHKELVECIIITTTSNHLRCSYYSEEFIFPDFAGQNESLSLTNLFTQNTNISFLSLANALETGSETKWRYI